MRTFSFIIILLFTFAAMPSCKISYSFTGADIPIQAKTVSVKLFPNYASVIYPSYSNNFTEALKDRFVSQTSLALTNGTGDLHFEGEIVTFRSDYQTVEKDQAALNRLTISVKVRYRNALDNKKNFEETFTQYVDYPANQNLDQVQASLSEQITEKLTEAIFNRAVVNW